VTPTPLCARFIGVPITVYVEESRQLNGVLRFSSDSIALDGEPYKQYLDGICSLKRYGDAKSLNDLFVAAGAELKFLSLGAQRFWNVLLNLDDEFDVVSPFTKTKKPYPFQSASLNVVWDCMTKGDKRFILQWDTGAGKTVAASLIAQRLFNEGLIDKVLVFCDKVKIDDWVEDLRRDTSLKIDKVSDKLTRSKRHNFYLSDDSDILVMNYEKARGPSKKRGQKVPNFSRTDLKEVAAIINGKRTLIVLDEAQKINTDKNLLRAGFDYIINHHSDMRVLALTATPYTTSPVNIFNILEILSPHLNGITTMTRDQFKRQYAKDYSIMSYGPWVNQLYVKEWDRKKLRLLGKSHERSTHIAMKSDPEIAKQFPESIQKKLIFDLSEEDKIIYQYILKMAQDRYDTEIGSVQWGYVDILRMVCNSSSSLLISKSKIAEEVVNHFGVDAFKIENSAKYQLYEKELEELFENNQKVVMFTYWTNATLFLYEDALKKKFGQDIPIIAHWGTGLDDSEKKLRRDKFNSISGPALFLTSDAGQRGLNLYAPYLYHIELPRMYSTYKQRSERINRADSKSKGINTTWTYWSTAKGTVEEKVEQKVILRKQEAEIIRGQRDSEEDMEDAEEIYLSPKDFLFDK
jgi:superfamily II DNA or RNA helicase